MPDPTALHLTTAAKVNLFLRVLGRRADGFHDLRSIFHSLDLADDVTVRSSVGGVIDVEMHGEAVPALLLPAPESNIVVATAKRMQAVGGTSRGASISILKRIPIGGGMGGGSSNAAGVLLALERLWGLDLERATLLEVGAEIGSDVPFCIGGGATAVVTGRGERIAPLDAPPTPLWFVLGISNDPLSTRAVYAAQDETVDEGAPGERAAAEPLALALGAGDVEEVARLLHNDLEGPAFHLRPRLRQDKQVLLEAGALGACMSGSGPTLFGIAPDRRSAVSIAARVADRFDRVVVSHSGAGCVTFV